MLNVANTTILPKALLANFTTFKLGGPCQYLIECATVESLQATVKELSTLNTPYILMGGGSNLVVSDQGIDAVVIRYVSATPLIRRENNDLIIAASTHLDSAAVFSVDEGLEGLVFTSGIPGTVGGAVVGNAGAWGKQVGDILKSALIIEPNGNIKRVGPDYFGFSYRHSKLKDSKEIVAEVTFELKDGDPALLAIERADILKKRSEKHPDLTLYPCAGSFFRNIEPTSKAEKRQATGWFLEEAGGKNLSNGGALIFDKHANIIIKGQGCTASDVYHLHLKMISIVKDKFGFTIAREVRFLGKFDGVVESNSQWFW